ncbi:MAG: hypothetical protein AAB214_20925 [Fibrobacterota bacterium]
MPESLGFIHYPGMRSRAFLCVLREMGIRVSTVIEMRAEIPNLDGIRQEDAKYGYTTRYFDTAWDLDRHLAAHPGTARIPTDAATINDPAISESLDSTRETTWIFSGGGILKPHLFRSGRNLLHVHPGRLPAFRGSTCFYYSLLDANELASTCFLLEPRLDCGQILHESRFCHNLKIRPDQRFFMDSILDPWMRAQALRGALSKPFPSRIEDPLPEESGNAFFVAHPFLRHLAFKRLNSRFRPDLPEGATVEDPT